MNLTPEDRAATQNVLAHVEKRARSWRKSRWVLLLGGLLYIGIGALLMWQISRIGELHENLASRIRPHAPTTMDLAIMRLRILVEVGGWSISVAVMIVGYAMAGMTWMKWHKGRDEAAMAKLARAVLAKLDESPQNTAQQPPSA
jgi:predicted anti-sigma-YlaC factor YlaD